VLASVATLVLFSSGKANDSHPCVSEYCDMQNSLFGWILNNGGEISQKIQFSTGPDPQWTIRGIFATQDISQGETILSLPPNLQICNPSMCDVVHQLTDELKKGGQSYWAPYIAAMDEHDVDIPAVWSDEEMSLLQGLYPFDWTRHTYWFINECNGDMSDAAAVRAMLLVVARSHGKENAACMSPLYDALNHDNARLNTMTQHGEGDFLLIRATRDIAAGEQVYNTFGQDGVGRFFRDYGFITQRPHKWEFMDSQQRLVTFLIVDDADDTLAIDVNPDRNHYQINLPDFFEEVRRQLEYLFANEPVPSENMMQNRVNMAMTYRQEYIRALELLHMYLESQIAGAGEM
jgi:hypothetical protein